MKCCQEVYFRDYNCRHFRFHRHFGLNYHFVMNHHFDSHQKCVGDTISIKTIGIEKNTIDHSIFDISIVSFSQHLNNQLDIRLLL